MKKKLLISRKHEKRVIKLLYRKGLLKEYDLKYMYWTDTYISRRNQPLHLWYEIPETYHYSESYAEELICLIHHDLYDAHVIGDTDWDGPEWPESTYRRKGNRRFIKYLKKLPSVVFDHRINKLLICREA